MDHFVWVEESQNLGMITINHFKSSHTMMWIRLGIEKERILLDHVIQMNEETDPKYLIHTTK